MPKQDCGLSDLDRWFHPDEDTLRNYLAHTLPVGVRDALTEHLVQCPQCAARLEVVEQLIDRGVERLAPTYARAREQARQRLGLDERIPIPPPRRRIVQIGRTLGGSRIAWAVAAAALVFLCLGIAWGRIGGRRLPSPEGDALPRGGAIAAQGNVTTLQWSRIEFLDEMDAYAQFPFERAVAYSIGLLNRMGVPLEADAMSFEGAAVYVVRPGDTWNGVAETLLGDRRLWPILVLLNPAEAQLGELSPSQVLRIPDSHQPF